MSRRTLTVKIGDADVVIQRPTYMEFRRIAGLVDALTDVEFGIAMTTPQFRAVLEECTQGDAAQLDDLDYADAAHLWDEVMSFCEFPAFFAERRRQHFERSKERMETEVDLQAAQYNRMKKRGLLPESFSLENALNAANPLAANPTSLPSSPTTTPATTDGSEATSKERISGLSSGTSPKRSAAAKR